MFRGSQNLDLRGAKANGDRIISKKPGLRLFSVSNVSILVLAVFFTGIIFSNQASAATITWVPPGTHYLGDGSVGAPVNVIEVTDATKVGAGNIQVQVNSTSDPIGIALTLNENPPGSGIFRDTNIIFNKGDGHIPLSTITHSRTITISILDADGNGSSISIDAIPVTVTSTSDPIGITPSFTETDVNTAIFSGKITFGPNPSSVSANYVHAQPGDEIAIMDGISALTANAIIDPNPVPSFNVISAKIGDTVTATYAGISVNIAIGDDTCSSCGGGGGGLVIHPGFVLDALAAIGGSPYVVSPPSFGGNYYQYSDGLTLTQGDTKTIFDTSLYNQEIPKQVMQLGTPVNMTFKTFESYNVEGVIHMGLYVIPRGEDMMTDNSIASIVWDKGQPVEVNDPNHILSNATVSPVDDGKFQYTTFSFTPTKSYDKMSFLVRAWNDHLYSTDIRVHDDIVAPQAAMTLPAGVIQYNNFDDLQAALEKDQFYKPQLLSHIHGTSDVFPNSEGGSVYWLYDTIRHTITLVVADKNDNVLSSKSASLQPYAIEKKGDYNFMYFTVQQLNRWNGDQLKNAMELEAAKAMSFALEKKIILRSNW